MTCLHIPRFPNKSGQSGAIIKFKSPVSSVFRAQGHRDASHLSTMPTPVFVESGMCWNVYKSIFLLLNSHFILTVHNINQLQTRHTTLAAARQQSTYKRLEAELKQWANNQDKSVT